MQNSPTEVKEPEEILCFTCIFHKAICAELTCLARNEKHPMAYICDDYSQEITSIDYARAERRQHG